mgnify:CR=1 FL=1
MTAFVCPECGYTALEYRPPECPVCRTPMDRFLSVEEGDPAWPHGHMVGMAEDCDAGVHQELVDSLEAVQAGVSVCLAMARQADREGYPEIAQAYGRIAREKAAHAARLRELLGHGLTFRTGENLRTQVEAEAKKGFDGRFGPGLPAISDGQMLFMLNGVKKLKEGSGRMAIIQNGSSLFTGDAGSGASEIRRYVIEGDLVEAIIQLPTDLFYNTGISTYIWVITKGKPMHRSGKVQLIDASKCFVKRRKNIGSKRVDLDDACIELILRAYEGFVDETYEENGLVVESKVFDNSFFGFTKVTVETAQADKDGKFILKKGKKQPVKGASDTEIIPLSEDSEAYMKKNVLPYNPLAYIDPAKDKIGYEVPFTRLFYKFEAPASSDSIFEEIKALEAEETILMKELFGHA